MWRQRIARLVPVLVVLVTIGIVVLTGWAVVTLSGGSDDTSSDQAGSVDTEPAPASRDTDRKSDQVAISRQAKEFSKLYFSFSPKQSPDEIKESVAPYVTERFLVATQFDLSSSEAVIGMRLERASIRVKPLTDLIGEFSNSDTATGIIVLRFTKYDSQGNVVYSFDKSQSMTLVRQGETWLIDDASYT